MVNTKEFISGLTWGAGLAVIINIAFGLVVKSNTFPVLNQFLSKLPKR